jgi:two-component system phosphate regulon sensor histidine kinase PhoR
VIVNIISNAVKYNRPDGKVSITGSESEDYVTMKISDTGIGIPEKDLSHIFERFYRVDKARSRERGGTGLGLAIAHEIVERHHGSLTAESVENEGTEFTLVLPKKQAEGEDGED